MPDASPVAAPALFDHSECCGGHQSSLHAGGSAELRAAADAAYGELGYIVMGFPRISETFISNEIALLESLGSRIRVYAVKQGDKEQVHDSVARIRAPITYLPAMTSLSGTGLVSWLRHNWTNYRAQHMRLLRQQPRGYLATLGAAIAMSWRYRKSAFRPRKVFIKEFLQAGHIAQQVLDAGSVRHLHGHFCHGATTITWFVSRLTGIPFSFTAHAKDIYQTDQNPGDLLPRKLAAARFVATCTGANKEHLDRRFPECKSVRTIYHGLDTQYFAPVGQRRGADASSATQSVPLLLAVGRLVEKKGFRYLIDACALLRNKDLNFRCLIVGEKGDQSSAINQQIKALGLTDVVTVQGPVTHAELHAIYARASLFVLPCLVAADGDRDGIPNVLAEAMAMGLPVVTTNVSGIPELVDADRDGLVVPERNAAELAQALEGLLVDGALRERLGRAARVKVCQMFDSRVTTQSLKALFDRQLLMAQVDA